MYRIIIGFIFQSHSPTFSKNQSLQTIAKSATFIMQSVIELYVLHFCDLPWNLQRNDQRILSNVLILWRETEKSFYSVLKIFREKIAKITDCLILWNLLGSSLKNKFSSQCALVLFATLFLKRVHWFFRASIKHKTQLRKKLARRTVTKSRYVFFPKHGCLFYIRVLVDICQLAGWLSKCLFGVLVPVSPNRPKLPKKHFWGVVFKNQLL